MLKLILFDVIKVLGIKKLNFPIDNIVKYEVIIQQSLRMATKGETGEERSANPALQCSYYLDPNEPACIILCSLHGHLGTYNRNTPHKQSPVLS